jgi:peptide/nickel transport system substrate-binding protein
VRVPDFIGHVARLTVAIGALSAGLTWGSAALAAEKTVVKAALLMEPQSLDPIYDTNLPAVNVFLQVFDQLTGIDAQGHVVPRLAISWTGSEDLKHWAFKLRPNVKCHDGTIVTSADVVFTYETAKNDPKSRLGGYFAAIDKIVANGDDEVDFVLNKPIATFSGRGALAPIVCKGAYQRMGAAAFARSPVGTGPYAFVSWAAGDAITLKRFDDYWGSKGTYPTVVFVPVPDESARANGIQSGDLDVALLGPSDVPAVRASGAVDVVEEPSNRVIYLGFDAKQKFLADPQIRKAADLAIDRKAVADRLLSGSVSPASQLVAPVTTGFDPKIPPASFDLPKAKALVAASGYDGSPIPFSYPTTGLPQVDQMSQAVAYFIEQTGLKLTIDAEPADGYVNKWFGDKLPGMYIFAFAPGTMDADLPFNMLLRTGGQGYFSDKEIDGLLDKEISQGIPAERAATLSSISKIVNEKTYYAPLFIDVYIYGVAKGLKWTPRPDGFILFN